MLDCKTPLARIIHKYRAKIAKFSSQIRTLYYYGHRAGLVSERATSGDGAVPLHQGGTGEP